MRKIAILAAMAAAALGGGGAVYVSKAPDGAAPAVQPAPAQPLAVGGANLEAYVDKKRAEGTPGAVMEAYEALLRCAHLNRFGPGDGGMAHPSECAGLSAEKRSPAYREALLKTAEAQGADGAARALLEHYVLEHRTGPAELAEAKAALERALIRGDGSALLGLQSLAEQVDRELAIMYFAAAVEYRRLQGNKRMTVETVGLPEHLQAVPEGPRLKAISDGKRLAAEVHGRRK